MIERYRALIRPRYLSLSDRDSSWIISCDRKRHAEDEIIVSL